MKILSLVLALILLNHLCIAQRFENYASLVEQVRPSVVLVKAFDESGKALKNGTGFCVSPQLFITNYHVIDGAKKVMIQTADNRNISVEVDSQNKTADIALLKAGTDIGLKPLRFASALPKVGTKILVVGNPLGLTGTASDGIVSAIRAGEEEYVQITAPISRGSSGSPVLNLDGDVVGVATLLLEGGQNLNFAISSKYIQSLWADKLAIASSSFDGPKPQFSTRWRQLTDKDTTYDKQSFSKNGDVLSVWIKYANKDTSYENVFYEMNCSTRRIRKLQSASYGTNGEIERSSSVSEEWQAIIPDSNGEAYFEIFCKGEPDRQAEIELDSLFESAEAYEKKKNYPGAIEAYWKILKFDSEHKKKSVGTFITIFLAQSGLENLYKQRKDFLGLEKLYRYEIERGYEHRYVNLARLYQEYQMTVKYRSTLAAGIKALEQGVSASKTTSNDYDALSSLYKLQGQIGRAIAILTKGLNRFPHDGSLAESLASIYNEQKRWKESVALIEEILPNLKENDKIFYRSLLALLKSAFQGLGDNHNSLRIERELKTLQ
jgi:tetratricopeptide (TPR) repeat protein